MQPDLAVITDAAAQVLASPASVFDRKSTRKFKMLQFRLWPLKAAQQTIKKHSLTHETV